MAPIRKYLDNNTAGCWKIGPPLPDANGTRLVRATLGPQFGAAVKITSHTGTESCAQNELSVYIRLQNTSNPTGFPRLLWARVTDDKLYLALSRHGHSLQTLHNILGPFSLKTVLHVGMQGIRRLQALHECGVVHCRVKPAHLVVGRNDHDRGIVHLISFRHAAALRTHTVSGIQPATDGGERVVGPFTTARHDAGERLGASDDLQMLCMTMAFLRNGTLPWITRPAMWKESLVERKRNTEVVELCRGFPREVVKFMRKVFKMTVDERPVYEELEGLLEGAYFRLGFEDDGQFDWENTPPPHRSHGGFHKTQYSCTPRVQATQRP